MPNMERPGERANADRAETNTTTATTTIHATVPPPPDLAVDYGGQVDGPCPLCGEDNYSDATFAVALTGRPRLCEACVDTTVPEPIREALQALNDLDTAVLLGQPFRRSILAVASTALEWMADEYGGAS